MSKQPSPTARRRRLSAELRQLRHTSGMTIEGAAEQLEWSRSRLAHMEGNKWTRPDVGNIRQLLDLYKVEDEENREAILTLARQSRQRGWWQKYSDVFRDKTYVGLEAEASIISTYQFSVIPGLLQTPEYAAASARASLARPAHEVQRIVDARMARQEILTNDTPPTVWAVLDEAVLRRIPQEVAHEQLQRLIDTASDDDNHVTIQALPFSAKLHPGISGPFVLLEFPAEVDTPVVYLETRTDGLYLEEDHETAEYTHVFDHLRAAARSQKETIELMQELQNNQ